MGRDKELLKALVMETGLNFRVTSRRLLMDYKLRINIPSNEKKIA